MLVLCLAALTASSVFARGVASPALATDVIGSPDAAVNGKLAVGSSSVGSKSLTVSGVIDFVGAGTVHNFFSQGGGNNMQINTNVDEANTVGDASKSQWKLVLGSSLDQFSIRRSPASGTYNEDALFWIDGSTGKVGIATVDTNNGGSIPYSPNARLDVVTTTGAAVRGETASDINDAAVSGYSTATNGFLVSGVYGQTQSTLGYGVYGLAAATTGSPDGVYGVANSTSGRGVYGSALATTGTTTGVWGNSDSTSGRGVFGIATATSGFTYGVRGESHSPNGYAVYGTSTSTTGSAYGVMGQSAATGGVGVYAYESSSTGTNYAVYGYAASPAGYAGFFNGDVHVSGTLSKSAGSFKIDDPLDPAHKYLQHSFVESPDMMNVYNGNVMLDDNGEAVVTMPDWFQALNQDFRYQLTAIGGPGPNLYVADEIQDNTFRIAGGEPGTKVSWQVTGIRHDPYAEAHRIQVVVDKPSSEEGTYLSPELYGQPASMGLTQPLPDEN